MLTGRLSRSFFNFGLAVSEDTLNQAVFDKSNLIEAIIEVRRTDHPHKDFEVCHKRLLEVLQRAFNLEFSMDGVQKSGVTAIWFLFSQTVDSYLHLNTRDGVLEAGLMEIQIERLNDVGQSINAKRSSIHELKQQSSRVHLELLNELFDVLWDFPEKPVTMDDLRALGFHLEKPQIQDYWDEM